MEDNTKIFNSSKNFHLAGIVPIAGQPLDFAMDWHDSLFPIAPNYTLVENAIYECAWAGCDTIWVVCHSDTTPLVRHRVGDFIQDPVWANRAKDINPALSMKRIPIFWVPIHPTDRDKRDCLSWSVIHGALSCLKVSSQLSKWLTPDKYYVSFPYGVFDPEQLRPHRKEISSAKNFYVSYNEKTVEDNLFISFTFGKDDFIKYRRQIRKGTGLYTTEVVDERGIPRSTLPIEERWSARYFDLKEVFVDLDLKDSKVLNVTEYFNISSWREYAEFLSTEYAYKLKRPSSKILNYREFNKIGIDLDSK